MTMFSRLSIAALVLLDVWACGGSEPLRSVADGSMGGSAGLGGSSGGGGSGGSGTTGASTSAGGVAGSDGVGGSGGVAGSIGTGGAPRLGGASGSGTGASPSTGGIRGSGGVGGTAGTRVTFLPDASVGGNTPAGGVGGKGAGGSTTGGATTLGCSGSYLRANDVSNYAFASTLTLPPISVASGVDLTFDWSSVTADMRGRPIDPKKDLNLIAVTMWELTLPELEAKLNADALVQRDLTVVPFDFLTDGSKTSAHLLSFTVNGVVIDPSTLLSYFDVATYPASNHVYLATAQTGTLVGQGARMLQAFRLDAASTNTTVKMTNTSTQVAYTVNLHDLVPLAIPARQAGITFDWSTVQSNAFGASFDPLAITEILVGRYRQSTTELERRFGELDSIAVDLYQGTVLTGANFDLSTLKDSAGKSFAGIDESDTWLVALRCGACRNPAPWYLSRLVPCQGGGSPIDAGPGGTDGR